MLLRILLGLIALLVVFLLLRWFARTPPATVKRFLFGSAVVLIIGILVYLAATGRLNWLFALGASLLALLRKLIPLIRYVPMVRGAAAKMKSAAAGTAGSAGQSQVESRFLRMILYHDSGDLQGEVIHGTYAGSTLEALSLEQLFDLLRDYRVNDRESAQLLEAYLDRVHGTAWRGSFTGAGEDAVDSHEQGPMSRKEALQILGLQEEPGRDEIVEAHRRLMQKMHPDRGGSTYLAAKINQAKDCLLGK